jgi:hypothetical protein
VLRAEKIKICMTLKRPVTTYGAEFWTLNNDIAERLATSEGKVLKEMCGELK